MSILKSIFKYSSKEKRAAARENREEAPEQTILDALETTEINAAWKTHDQKKKMNKKSKRKSRPSLMNRD